MNRTLKTITTTIILLLVIWPISLVHAQYDESDWKLVTDRDGIRVYMAHGDDARVKTFRGVTELQVDDWRALGAQVDDYKFVASWLHMVSEIRDLGRSSDTDREIYVTTRLPWPVSDRDAPLKLTLSQDSDTYAWHVHYINNPDGMSEQSSYVRMPQMEGNIIFLPLQQKGHVEMTFEVVVDPGGYIPAWLANLILRDIPYFSMQRYSRVINLERYKGASHDYYKTPPWWQ